MHLHAALIVRCFQRAFVRSGGGNIGEESQAIEFCQAESLHVPPTEEDADQVGCDAKHKVNCRNDSKLPP